MLQVKHQLQVFSNFFQVHLLPNYLTTPPKTISNCNGLILITQNVARMLRLTLH